MKTSRVKTLQNRMKRFKRSVPCQYPNLFSAAFGMDLYSYSSRQIAGMAIEAVEYHGVDRLRQILKGEW